MTAAIVETPTRIERQTYTVAEAAEILGISRRHMADMCGEGQIPYLRFGRKVVVLRDTVERLLEQARLSTN